MAHGDSTKPFDLFLALLRTGLYGKPLTEKELPERIDWDEIVALADMHGVLGTIIEAVEYLPESLRPSGEVTGRMGRFAMGLIHANLILDRTVVKLVTTLREHGINGVLLKGQGVARYYRKPQMRQSGDIDFYVGKRVYSHAVRVCKETLKDNRETSIESRQHYAFYTDGVEIELHRLASQLNSRRRDAAFQQWIVEELENSHDRRRLTLGDTEVMLPSYDFDALYIFYHAWNHLITGGIGLRQLSDWAMIFSYHSDDIDTDRLVENIRRFGLTAGWKLFAYIAVRYLGVEEAKMPLYDGRHAKRYDKVMEDIVTGGNFGYHSEAGLRMTDLSEGLGVKLGKLRSITEYFIALFPIIPAEATSIYINRLLTGTRTSVKKWMRRRDNKQHE